MRVLTIILCLVVGALLLGGGGGGLWLWMSMRRPGGNDDNEEYLEEFEDLDFDYTEACSQLSSSKTLDSFWDCLEANAYFMKNNDLPDNAKYPPQKENPFTRNWQVRKRSQEFKNTPNKGKKYVKKGGRQKRSAEQRQNYKPGPYKPTHTNYALNSAPYQFGFEVDNPPVNSGDAFYTYNRYLYTYNETRGSQQQPPWSYDGEFGQEKWHELDIEKFFVPVNPIMGKKLNKLHRALLMDQWSESKWNDIWFRYLYLRSAYEGKIFNGPLPPHVTDWSGATLAPFQPPIGNAAVRSLIPNDPNEGYYSSDRFLLPPPPSTNEINDFKKKNLISPDIQIPAKDGNYQHFAQKRLRWASDLSSLSPQEYAIAINDLSLWFEDAKLFYSRVEDTRSWPLTVNVFQNLSADMVKFEKERTKDLKLRTQLSLPLLPHPYPICQQQEPSPIDILDEYSTISSIRPYEFDKNFNKLYRAIMYFPDDGTNILSVKLEDSDPLIGRAIGLTGGATGGVKLYFENMFIHVGKTETTGTEHKLQGKGYAMELQLLFTYRGPDRDSQQPYYKTLVRQQNDLFPFRGKIALMLALLVEAKPDEEVKNKFLFEPLTQLAYKFREQEERARGGPTRFQGFRSIDFIFRLSDFIPTDAQFYTYRGGLTFPPCFGYLPWSVYNTTLEIPLSQFRQFQFLPTVGQDDSEYLAGNVRQIDSEWVEGENTVNIPPAEKKRLREIRTRRLLLKSLDPKLYGVKGNESHYDYYYDYDKASSPYISKVLIALLPTTVITLFYN